MFSILKSDVNLILIAAVLVAASSILLVAWLALMVRRLRQLEKTLNYVSKVTLVESDERRYVETKAAEAKSASQYLERDSHALVDDLHRAVGGMHQLIEVQDNAFQRQLDKMQSLIADQVSVLERQEKDVLDIALLSQPSAEVLYLNPQVTADAAAECVDVFYATNRERSEKTDEMYSGERSARVKEGGSLDYGEVTVSIPSCHRVAQIERPTILRLEVTEDIRKHFAIAKWTSMEQAKFFTYLGSKLRAADREDVFVFVHGYNTDFRNACFRTAQMHYDMNFPGVPVLFSWPSKGAVNAYPADEESAAWSKPHLEEFLAALLQVKEIKRLHLVAHSLGNRPLVDAVAALQKGLNTPLFNMVVLTAPDIALDQFRQVAADVLKAGTRVTVYASRKDKALEASRYFHSSIRLGDGADSAGVFPGIDAVDASLVSTDFLSHSYFANTLSVLVDIAIMLRHGDGPGERPGLAKATTANGAPYWVLRGI